MFEARIGTIVDYSDFKLYGYIFCPSDNITYYFHKSDCIKFLPENNTVVKFLTGSMFLGSHRAICITKEN